MEEEKKTENVEKKAETPPDQKESLEDVKAETP